MAKKRANGEGSVNKRKDGRWQASITLGRNEQGKPKRVTYYGHTRKEVSEKLKAALADQQKGTYIPPNQDELSVYVDAWLAAKKVSVSRNTYNKYENMARIHIKPVLGDYEVQKITRNDIQNFITAKSEVRSPETIASIHMVLKNILEVAVSDQKISRNPCTKIELPKIIEPPIRILTEEEMTAILTATFDTKVYDVVFLEYSTGLRRGEILGLNWDDIDFDNNTISVNKQWIVINGVAQWSDVKTKTKSSTRLVAVPPETITELEAKRKREPKTKYLFQSANGTLFDPNNFRRDFKTFANRGANQINEERLKENPEAELVDLSTVTFHDLRHNYATQLVALNIHTRLIQAQLGHSDERSTHRYTHATDQGQREAAEKIGQTLTAIKSGCCQVAVKTPKMQKKASKENP